MKKILIADDSLFMRTWLKRILNELTSVHFIEAENGYHALDMYIKYNPDLVLMDITMPKLNGLEALKEIMKMDAYAKVVICSSLGQQHLILDTLKIGAKDFVVKPHFENLISIVNKNLVC